MNEIKYMVWYLKKIRNPQESSGKKLKFCAVVSHLHNGVQRRPTLEHLQFPAQDLVQPQ